MEIILFCGIFSPQIPSIKFENHCQWVLLVDFRWSQGFY